MFTISKPLLAVGTLFLSFVLMAQWSPLTGASPAQACSVPDDFGTIQEAVDDPDCEMISIGDGIFTENVTIDRMVIIAGQGTDNTEVNGNASGRVFSIETDEPVTLKNLNITNGLAEDGGGINQTNGVLVVENCTVTGNSASFRGGGIFSQSAFGTASTSIINSTISGNTAVTRGGGINNEGDDATLTIVASTIDNNSASEGGGIFNLGAVSIENSILSSNSADQGGGAYNSSVFTFANGSFSENSAQQGGGIYNRSAFGNVTVMSSTLNENYAAEGAGIYNHEGGTASVNSSTFSLNEASVDGGGVWNSSTIDLNYSTLSGNLAYEGNGLTSMLGGGIYNSGGSVTLHSSTLSDNYAGLEGDSVFNDAGSVTLSNSILSNVNVNLPNTDDDNCAGDDITSAGFNLENGTTCNLAAVGDIPDTDPLLGPLADSGGDTDTHALITGSPAIDAGNCPGKDADQRGFSRPVDMLNVPNAADACDIGAYEVHYVIYLPFLPRP